MDGKFLRAGAQRFWLKGVSYGTFAPDANGQQFPAPSRIQSDFDAIRLAGFNTVRTYTPPGPAVVEAAARAGLRLMAGLPWSQHVAFLDDGRTERETRRVIRESARQLRDLDHVALISLGNEIPASIVRWHGARRVERFLADLLDVARQEAPDHLFAYVNFPPTEFLDLSAFDVSAFNVYLHEPQALRAYLARLQNIAGDKPLLLAEAGADSVREGELGQAALTAMQVRAAFAEGCAGAVAFAWTDDWWRGGQPVDDWRFGLVDRDRIPKPALDTVSCALGETPFSTEERRRWPSVSVIVCAYNAERTIAECLDALCRMTYPDFEILVINDGSRDDTGSIARRFDRVRTVDVPNGGLSAARNVGLGEATGTVVAYVDADARVDPDWLTFLVQPLNTDGVVAAGGPNVVPEDDPWMAQCVARSPGAPIHVLLDDRTAEHVPGCNMAFRRDALRAIGGFNTTYVKAGDDVDVCWRIQARGWRIGFAPAALVWHHHRDSIRAYWRQQVGYGEGEAWLTRDHPDKFVGRHVIWQGRIYSPLPAIRSTTSRHLQTGAWGTASFPSVYHTHADRLPFLPHSIGFQAVSATTALLGLLAFVFFHESVAWLLALVGGAGVVVTWYRCLSCAAQTALPARRRTDWPAAWAIRLAIAWLHWLQPWARFWGRIKGHAAPNEHRPGTDRVRRLADVTAWCDALRLMAGRSAEYTFWNERWQSREEFLTRLVHHLRSLRLSRRLDIDDGWQQRHDIRVPLDRWNALLMSALIEEHAEGRTLLRARLVLSRRWSAAMLFGCAALLAGLSVGLDGWKAAAACGLSAVATLAAAGVVGRTASTLAGVTRVLTDVARSFGAEALPAASMRRRAADPRLRPVFRGLVLVAVAALPLGGLLSVANLVRMTVASSVALPAVAPPAARVAPWREPGVGLAIAPNGDVYLADARTDSIRRMSARGAVSTVSLAFASPTKGPAGPRVSERAPVRRLDAPGGVAVSPSGDLYVADSAGHRVYRVDRLTGATHVIAGTGEPGFGGDGGSAIRAQLHTPTAVAFDRSHRVWIADAGNHRIRRIDARHIIETVAGGVSDDTPSPAAADGPATLTRLAWPSDLAVAPNGDLYIADTENNRVCRVDAKTGFMHVVAGTGEAASNGDGGQAIHAGLLAPTGLALAVRNQHATVYIAEVGGRVRVVAPDGTIASLRTPSDAFTNQSARLAYHPRGWLYVADAPDRLTALSLTGARPRLLQMGPRPRRLPRPM